MRTRLTRLLSVPLALGTIGQPLSAGVYRDRFLDLYGKIQDPQSGYFSPDGGPYHSIETLIVEAPDHGHESTSEGYSYLLQLEAYYGMATGDWAPLRRAWRKIEEHIIPRPDMQPSNSSYKPSAPAALTFEFDEPSGYPAPIQFNKPVGVDPVSQELATTYGTWDVYGMHWLLDLDNTYGYGNKGDGVSTPSYINTFQRGRQESVWETVPHPSWEEFKWGSRSGFLPLFALDQTYSKQWRYTNAPDADARVVQIMHMVHQALVKQGKNPATELPEFFGKAAKMADYLRLAMFDKYFKKLGSQSPDASGSGYDSAHYLMSWYYAWGGSLTAQNGWAFRIGSSHAHFGYQNPMAAYAAANLPALTPKSPNAKRDWQTSLRRQLEFYKWLQSEQGAIAGGATNSWNGRYERYPAGTPTFYGMAYEAHPVYADPGSNSWFGWQAWSMERVAEYYYATKDPYAKSIIEKWTKWVLAVVRTDEATGYAIPSTLVWTGAPATWNPTSPAPNTNLKVTVADYSQDVGVAASLARALMFFAAADSTTLGQQAKGMAGTILDGMWLHHRTDKGLANLETRGDYKRLFDEVFIPAGFSGQTPLGARVAPGATFLSLRPFYDNDPGLDVVLDAISEGVDPKFTYHRFWAQAEAASAYLQFETLFGGKNDPCNGNCKPVALPKTATTYSGMGISITLEGQDQDGTITAYQISAAPKHGQLTLNADKALYTPAASYVGPDDFSFVAIDNGGLKSEPARVDISVLALTAEIVSPVSGAVFRPGETIQLVIKKPQGFGLAVYLNGGFVSRSGTATSFTLTLPSTAGDQRIEVRLVNQSDQTVGQAASVMVRTQNATSGVSCSVREDVWNGGFVAYLTVRNGSSSRITSWKTIVTVGANETIQNSWNGAFTATSGGTWQVTNLSYNGQLEPGQSTEFGFVGLHGGTHVPVTCRSALTYQSAH